MPVPARLVPLTVVLGACLSLVPLVAAGQPTRLEIEDQRGPSAPRSALLDEHPWVPDVMALVGLAEPGPPIRVLLVPESSAVARGVPAWVAGFAEGTSTVVLLPQRTPGYPDGGLEEVLAHEVAHVLIARATSGRAVPRWFHEGIAMVAGRSWGLQDRTRLAMDLLSGSRVPLHRLDDLFSGDDASVRRAYALAGSLVQELLEKYGPGLPRAIFSRMGRGDRFEDAMRQVTGATPLDVAEIFSARQSFLRRWIPVVTSGAALWFGITVMAIVAGRKRRRRHREQLARMAAEEEAAARDAERMASEEEAAARAAKTAPMDPGGHDDWPVN
jgi:hypothetical protein